MQDVDSATKVALLGKTVVDNLFGTDDPVGQVIRIKKVPFTVLGVLEAKGQSPTGQDQDDLIIIPLTTAKRRKCWEEIKPGLIRLEPSWSRLEDPNR